MIAMAGINAEMTPKELMDSFVPELISSKLAGVEFAPLQGTIQVDVLGAGQWVATIEGGRPSLKPGKAEAPWVTVVVSDAALRMGIGRAAGEIGDSASVKVSGLARQMADNLTQQIIDTIRAQ
ncbi:MAG TPA: hypothetical protein VJN91_04590, partial [Gammaproteobacteria bacterium]|nr:hypothetical protein [Gammaproteobacteria bacterium]